MGEVQKSRGTLLVHRLLIMEGIQRLLIGCLLSGKVRGGSRANVSLKNHLPKCEIDLLAMDRSTGNRQRPSFWL